MRTLRQLRRSLYRAARLLGHISAVSRGPRGIARRLLNVALGRSIVRRIWR